LIGEQLKDEIFPLIMLSSLENIGILLNDITDVISFNKGSVFANWTARVAKNLVA